MGKKLNLKWVSEVIKEDYSAWNPGDIVTIQAQTGTGKTYFITGGKEKEGLIDKLNIFEKMIYICNRIELKRQLKKDLLIKFGKDVPELENGELDIEKLDKITEIENIVITSYHAIAEGELDNKYLNKNNVLDDFKYIICDECHFFLTDADFCNKSYLAFEQLVENKHENSIKIFISATMDELLPIIQKMNPGKVWPAYTTGIDYSYLNVKYFSKIDVITQLIKNDKTDDKWMIFVTSKNHGFKLQEELDNMKISNTFIYSGSKTNDGKSITATGTFKSKVLISTKCLDNGVNITDETVKNMVVMAYDKTTFIQEIGRRRFNIHNAPSINLYINTMYKKSFAGKVERYEDKFEMIDLYKNDTEGFKREYNNKLYKIADDLFYLDDLNEWKLNKVGYARLIKDNVFALDMIDRFNEDTKYAYIRQQLEWLGIEKFRLSEDFIDDVVDEDEVLTLVKYLDSVVGTKVLSEQQQEISDLIIKDLTSIGNGIDYRTKKIHVDTINSILKNDLEIGYHITSTKTSKRIDGKVKKYTYWTILKTIE